MIEILVESPNVSLITKNGRVNLHGIFLQDDFFIHFPIEGKFCIARLNLPEWLIHFTKFLNSKQNYESQMILSGDQFRGQCRSDGLIEVIVFDKESCSECCLTWERQEAVQVHRALYNVLHRAIDQAAGRPTSVENDELIHLDAIS